MSWYNHIPVVSTALGMQEEDPYVLNQQRALNGQLQASALGNVPSAAELQGRRAADAATSSAYALGASAPGVAPAAALRMAGANAANAQQDIAGQAAALRAQEQERARQLYALQLSGQRQAALGMQQSNAAALGGTLSAIGQAAAPHG